MPQYLIVRCTQKRAVLIGGVNHGNTDDVIELPASGPYTVTLMLVMGDSCTPTSHEVNLLNTTALSPREVRFVLA